MKTQSDLHLYLLKKVHGWCKRQGITDFEMYFQCTFREYLQRYGMLLTEIKTINNRYGGHHTFTFTPAPGTEVFGDTNSELESIFDNYGSMDYFEYEQIRVIRNHEGIISIRGYYPI